MSEGFDRWTGSFDAADCAIQMGLDSMTKPSAYWNKYVLRSRFNFAQRKKAPQLDASPSLEQASCRDGCRNTPQKFMSMERTASFDSTTSGSEAKQKTGCSEINQRTFLGRTGGSRRWERDRICCNLPDVKFTLYARPCNDIMTTKYS